MAVSQVSGGSDSSIETSLSSLTKQKLHHILDSFRALQSTRYAADLDRIKKFADCGFEACPSAKATNFRLRKEDERYRLLIPSKITTMNEVQARVFALHEFHRFLKLETPIKELESFALPKFRQEAEEAKALELISEAAPAPSAEAKLEQARAAAAPPSPQMGDSVSVEMNADQKVLMSKIGGDDDSFKQIPSRMATDFNNDGQKFGNVHIAYSARLKLDLPEQGKAVQSLTRLFNSFVWMNSMRKEPASLDQLYIEFAGSLKSFIEESFRGDLSGLENAQIKLAQYAERIKPEDLLESVAASFDADQLAGRINQLKPVSRATKAKEPASFGLLGQATSTSRRIGHQTTGLTLRQDSGEGTAELMTSLESYEVDADFLRDLFQGEDGYKVMYSVVDEICNSIKTDLKSQGDPFQGKIPQVLVEGLDLALDRDSAKASTNPPEHVKYYTHLIERAQYLLYLSNTLNSHPDFVRLCKGRSNPAAYALPFILLNYFEGNEKREAAYSSILEQLGKEIPLFADMKDTIVHLREALAREARKKEEAKIDEELASPIAERNARTSNLLKLAATNPVAKTAAILEQLSMANGSPFAQPNAEAFFIRLSKLDLNDHSYVLMLNNRKEEAVKELFYLLTGQILTGDISRDELTIFDISSGTERKISRKEAQERFSRARRDILGNCHPDSVQNKTFALSSVATIMSERDANHAEKHTGEIAANTVSFLNGIENIFKTGKGWERNLFADSLRGIQSALEESKILPVLMDYAQSPESNKRFSLQLGGVKSKQNQTVDLLAAMWRSISSGLKPSNDSKKVSAILKQLQA
ncbi:MAG: hypothetical protein OXU45_02735 [Candidatus Melainabacteria bacterium]|nr:hypothetical protein [Candidatus Melainabacteria bacterium]